MQESELRQLFDVRLTSRMSSTGKPCKPPLVDVLFAFLLTVLGVFFVRLVGGSSKSESDSANALIAGRFRVDRLASSIG